MTDMEKLYRCLIEQLPEGIILTDDAGRIVFVNRAAENIRNIDRKDITGNNVISCHRKKSHEKVMRAMEYLKKNADRSYRRMVKDRDNSRIYENNYTALCGDEGKMCGMAVISRDITEHIRSEEVKAGYARMQESTIKDLKEKYDRLFMNSMGMLTDLLEAKDIYTDGHSKRVAEIDSKMYNHVNGFGGIYFDIQYAAKLHDIGKICVPEKIIAKPGRLTSQEFAVMKRHSSIAADITDMLDCAGDISRIIRHHHERFDGRGYPDGLRGKDIPEGSRVIAVADSFDAMISDRPYRKTMTYDESVKEIQSNSGSQFDPAWVGVFCELAQTGSI